MTTSDHSWMRPVLLALFETVDDLQLRECLTSDRSRAELRVFLNQNTLHNGKLGAIPVDSYGDNLLHGLLALRAKFDPETAMAKLDVNLAMRARTR